MGNLDQQGIDETEIPHEYPEEGLQNFLADFFKYHKNITDLSKVGEIFDDMYKVFPNICRYVSLSSNQASEEQISQVLSKYGISQSALSNNPYAKNLKSHIAQIYHHSGTSNQSFRYKEQLGELEAHLVKRAEERNLFLEVNAFLLQGQSDATLRRFIDDAFSIYFSQLDKIPESVLVAYAKDCITSFYDIENHLLSNIPMLNKLDALLEIISPKTINPKEFSYVTIIQSIRLLILRLDEGSFIKTTNEQ